MVCLDQSNDKQGAASFVKKTIFGLSDSMTKFTSSVGKGQIAFP